MSVKSDISRTYLHNQRVIHGHKPWMDKRIRAIVIGALKHGSIGKAIANSLESMEKCEDIWCPDMDVRDCSNHDLFTRFNVLVLSHGVTFLGWFEEVRPEKFHEIIDVNLFGTANIIQQFVQKTIGCDERKRIIIIGSMAHRSVLNGSAVYCASKAGVAMLSRCLAWELAPKGFDVFCIHPSNTEGTPMTEETIAGLERYRGLSRGQAESYWNDSPIRSHILQTDDIAGVVKFLLTPGAEWLAGAQLEMGGGQR